MEMKDFLKLFPSIPNVVNKERTVAYQEPRLFTIGGMFLDLTEYYFNLAVKIVAADGNYLNETRPGLFSKRCKAPTIAALLTIYQQSKSVESRAANPIAEDGDLIFQTLCRHNKMRDAITIAQVRAELHGLTPPTAWSQIADSKMLIHFAHPKEVFLIVINKPSGDLKESHSGSSETLQEVVVRLWPKHNLKNIPRGFKIYEI